MERRMSVEWIARLLEHPDLLRMGHSQSAADENLGLGWLYYAFGRILRSRRAVVIGSWRGFAPLVIGKALQDNLEPGEVIFIDPSFVDDFWTDVERVREYFQSFGVKNIRHFRMTTQEFVGRPKTIANWAKSVSFSSTGAIPRNRRASTTAPSKDFCNPAGLSCFTTA